MTGMHPPRYRRSRRAALAGAVVVVVGLSAAGGACTGTGTNRNAGSPGPGTSAVPPPSASIPPATSVPPATSAPAATSVPPATSVPAATSPAPTTSSVPASVAVGVWFLNSSHAATGEEPLYQPVYRRVQPPALAARALDALFAGPTREEQAAGLRLVTSGATGYTRLHIGDGIAYVTLEGGCTSNGSTITIAGEIVPSLRQFASVTYVKIFAPDGTTETPTGPVDSIPTCLEP